MGAAERPWPHQYSNKKGACLFIFLLFTRSHGRCQTWAVDIERAFTIPKHLLEKQM